MKISVFLLVILLITSCDGFETKKLEKDTIISEQLNTFNWNDVDQYPSFQICDDLEDKLDKKACFETEITNYFFESLNNENILVSERIEDAIYLDLLISEKGQVIIISKKITPHTRAILPKIDTLLEDCIKKLPKIYPAIKRGQQVRTQFTLPILIEMDSVY